MLYYDIRIHEFLILYRFSPISHVEITDLAILQIIKKKKNYKQTKRVCTQLCDVSTILVVQVK